MKLFPQYLEMRIWDQGVPFDLLAQLQEIIEEISQNKIDPLEYGKPQRFAVDGQVNG